MSKYDSKKPPVPISQPRLSTEYIKKEVEKAKIYTPDKTLIAELQKILEKTFPDIETAEGREIVLVMGCTGSGKSTGVNYLLGVAMEPVYDGDEDDDDREITSVKLTENVISGPKIGHTAVSETLAPGIFPRTLSPGETGLSFCDCPGFMENRGEAEKIYATISNHMVISFAKSIKAIFIVLEYNSIKNQRGAGFRDLVNSVKNYIADPANMVGSIFIAISKAPPKRKREKIIKKVSGLIHEILKQKNEEIKRYFPSKETAGKKIKELERECDMLTLLSQCTDKIIILNVFDNKIDSRERILTLLKESKSIPKKLFEFNPRDRHHIRFNELIAKLIEELFPLIEGRIDILKQIKRYLDKMSRTEREIASFKANLQVENNAFSGEIERAWDRLIKNTKDEINVKDNEINSLSEQIKITNLDIQTLDNELKFLAAEEPELYWTLEVKEKRNIMPVIRQISRTNKKFRYDDMPFTSVNKTYENGCFDPDKTEMDESKGIFRAVYRSDFGKDGFAQIHIYVPRCKIDGNVKLIASKIVSIKTKQDIIKDQDMDLEQWQKDKKRLQEDLGDLLRGIDIDRAEKIREYKNKIINNLQEEKEKLNNLEVKVKELVDQSDRIDKEYDRNEKLIQMVIKIIRNFRYVACDEYSLLLMTAEDKVAQKVTRDDIIGLKEENNSITAYWLQGNNLIKKVLQLTPDELKKIRPFPSGGQPLRQITHADEPELVDKIILICQLSPLAASFLTLFERQQQQIDLQRPLSLEDKDSPLTSTGKENKCEEKPQAKRITTIAPVSLTGSAGFFHSPPATPLKNINNYPLDKLLTVLDKTGQQFTALIRPRIIHPNGDFLTGLIIDGLKETAISGNCHGLDSIKLKRRYYRCCGEEDKNFKHWQKFQEKLEKNKEIVQYIDRNHILDAKATMRDKFYDVLDNTEGGLYARIVAVPSLQIAFGDYNDCYNSSFLWKDRLSSALKLEYTDYITKPHIFILPTELAIIAHIFKVNISYETSPKLQWKPYDAKESMVVSVKWKNDQMIFNAEKLSKGFSTRLGF